MKRKRVVSEHYVNNKEFLEALVVFKAKCLAAKEAGEQRPQISNCLLYTSPSPRDGLLSRMPSSA